MKKQRPKLGPGHSWCWKLYDEQCAVIFRLRTEMAKQQSQYEQRIDLLRPEAVSRRLADTKYGKMLLEPQPPRPKNDEMHRVVPIESKSVVKKILWWAFVVAVCVLAGYAVAHAQPFSPDVNAPRPQIISEFHPAMSQPPGVASAEIESASRNVFTKMGLTKLPLQDRLDMAWTTVERTLDIEGITMRTLAPQWEGMTEQQQDEAILLVGRFLHRATGILLQQYKNNGQLIFYAEGAGSVPETRIVYALMTWDDGDRTPVIFFVRLVNGHWRVYDINAGGVSFLSNYRAQFQRLWRDGGWTKFSEALR